MNNSSVLNVFQSPAVSRIVPFAVFMAFIVVEDIVADRMQANGIDTRWLYAVRTVVVALVLFGFWRCYSELRSFSGVTVRRLLLGLGSGVAVFYLWINLDQSWATLGQPVGFDPTLPNGSGIDWTLVAFRIVGSVVIVSIMEELFWRSFLLRWIKNPDFLQVRPATVGVRAFLISALLFALEHHLWLAGLIAGVVYNWVYMRTGSVWIVILAHAVTNGLLACYVLATGRWEFW